MIEPEADRLDLLLLERTLCAKKEPLVPWLAFLKGRI
jgi:hypothetical protein